MREIQSRTAEAVHAMDAGTAEEVSASAQSLEQTAADLKAEVARFRV